MKKKIPALLVCLTLGSGQAFAGNASGRVAGESLQRIKSARAVGMGEAFVARSGDLDSVNFNPAGSAGIGRPAIAMTYFKGLEDNNFGSLVYSQTMGQFAPVLGFSYFDAGNIELNLSDGTTGSRKAQQDSVGFAGTSFLIGGFAVGALAKFYRFELAEQASASGTAFDAGALWNTPLKGFSIGGSAVNLGGDVQYEEEGDPLPETIRGGFSYLFDFELTKLRDYLPYEILTNVDFVKQKEEDSGIHGGLELRRSLHETGSPDFAALRGGYMSESKAITAGVGIQLSGFMFDYGISFIPDLDETHRVTIGYQFPTHEKDEDTGSPKLKNVH